LWAAGTARRFARGGRRRARRRVARHARRCAVAQIDLDRLAGRRVEDEYWLVVAALCGFLGRERHAGEIARGDTDIALEGDRSRVFGHERRLRGELVP